MAEEEDFSNLPLTDRWVHKNWKVRKEAYEAAAKEFKVAQENAPIVRDFVADSGLWKGAAADSNVAAQQEGLAALCAFLEIAGKQGGTRTRTDTITPICEKGLTGRPAAKASALEALMLYIEVDKSDPVIDELIPLLAHKQPKVIAATLAAMTAIVHAYGCKTVEPKAIIKQLPKVYGHADKNVRAEAQNLTVELYRWLKDAMKPLFWGELKPVQQTDLEKLFDKVKDEPSPKQERLLRSQQAQQESRAAAGEEAEEGGDEDAAEPEVDLEPEYMAVDVFPKIPNDLQEKLASTKWKDRKDALDDLFTAVNVPAIEEGPFDEIIRACAKCMKDANIQVVQVAANSVEAIAKGLKKKFAKYRNIILSPMLERFKEKKQSVADALSAACDAVFQATSVGEILEETLESLKHKNPLVKQESSKFLARSLKTTRQAPELSEVKLISDAAKILLTDGQAPTREAGAEILGILWKIMGDRNMLPHLEGLDELRKTKVKEYSEQAEVKAKWKPKAAPAPAKPAAAPGGQRKGPPSRRPAGTTVKKAAPVRAPSPLDDPAPLAPRPTSRPAAKAAAPARSTAAPGGGLKKPGLARPGSVISPAKAKVPSDDYGSVAPPRGLPTPGRGLAARPLAKPASQSYDASPPPSPRAAPQQSSLSLAERTELADLRAEVELLRNQNADLRTDKLRLSSQITELQNQNASLIEDHTRDMLSVKAKETQLVRARSDLDESDERCSVLGREVDKLKRLLQSERMGGAMSPVAQTTRPESIATLSRGGSVYHKSGAHHDSDGSGSGGGGAGKENSLPRELMLPRRLQDSTTGMNGRVMSPPLLDEDNIRGNGGGRQSPAGFQRPTARPLSNFVRDGSAASSRTNSSVGGTRNGYGGGGAIAANGRAESADGAGGQESWRRAAEVTQNLKARIELMKAKQAGRTQ